MNEIIETTWKGDMAFDSVVNGFTIKIDADEQFGGKGYGPRPKPLLLNALAGCTAMDVISILKKKKIIPTEFRVFVEGTLTENHPKIYKTIVVTFEFKGENWENDPTILAAAQRAIQLSTENYCGVNAMLRGTCEISNKVRIINI